MLFFDTETTGLIKESNQNPESQPHIIELALIITDSKGNEIARGEQLINPGVPIDEEITEITGIDDAMVKNAPVFAEVREWLDGHFRMDPDYKMMAHNARFDHQMLYWELYRIDRVTRFSWPREVFDTMILSGGLSLKKWSAEVLAKDYGDQTHRAMGDVERLLACWRAANNQGGNRR